MKNFIIFIMRPQYSSFFGNLMKKPNRIKGYISVFSKNWGYAEVSNKHLQILAYKPT